MSFFSSQKDYVRRSPSRDRLHHSSRYTLSSSAPFPNSLQSSSSTSDHKPRSPTQPHSEALVSPLYPSPGPSISGKRGPQTAEGVVSEPISSKPRRKVTRVPVPTEASLVMHDSIERSKHLTVSSHQVDGYMFAQPSLYDHANSIYPPTIEIGKDNSSSSGRGGVIGARSEGVGESFGSGISGNSFKMDLKRMMSKPAQSTSSLASNLSGSQVSIQMHNSERSRSKELLVSVTTTIATVPAKLVTPPRPSTNSPGESGIPRPRNVLRRKPSAKLPSASTTHAIRSKSLSNFHQTDDRESNLVSSSRQTASSPAHRTSRTNTPPKDLTPAGAVAAAYKQQANRKEELASTSTVRHGEEGTISGPYFTVYGSTSNEVVAAGEQENIGWNFTNHNNNMDRRKRGMVLSSSPTRANELHGGATAAGSLKKLTRKVSARWRKVNGSMDVASVTSGPAKGSPEDRRPSLQERRSSSLPHRRRKSLGLSVDGFVDMKLPQAWTGSRSPTDDSGPVNWPTEAITHEDSKETKAPRHKKEESSSVSTGGKLWKLMKRLSSGGLKEKYSVHGSMPPVLPLPPPVPTIPKDLQDFTLQSSQSPSSPLLSRFTDRRSSFSESSRPTYTPIKPQRNVSGPPVLRSPAPRPTTVGNKPSPSGVPINHCRPSTTTMSSSPESSDIASSKFWNRTRSARSSMSSYGDVPPVPKASIGQQILSLSELSRLEKEGWDGDLSSTIESPTRHQTSFSRHPPLFDDDDAEDTDMTARPSLPIPPRRNIFQTPGPTGSTPRSSARPGTAPASAASPSDDSNSPFRLKISTSHRLSYSPLPGAEFGLATSPLRPARNPNRPTAMDSPVFSTVSSESITSSPARSPEDQDIAFHFHPAHGNHNASISATRSQRSNHSDVKPSPITPTRSPLNFRELSSSSKSHVWTEKEKAKRWDDLLEMSKQAGGTIHLGDGGLLSDSERYSITGEDALSSTN